MTFKEKTKMHVNNEKIFTKLEEYVFLIEKRNMQMNLTKFADDVLWEEGIYESIISLEQGIDSITTSLKLLDIGAGVGFPSIPYLIVNPKVELHIFEPIKKRAVFLEEVSQKLDLKINIEIKRVEVSNKIEFFDFVTARAVASLKILIEASAVVGKIGSKYIFVKGPKIQDEVTMASHICDKLGIIIQIIKVNKIHKKNVFLGIFTKESTTPKGIPRNWAQIAKK